MTGITAEDQIEYFRNATKEIIRLRSENGRGNTDG